MDWGNGGKWMGEDRSSREMLRSLEQKGEHFEKGVRWRGEGGEGVKERKSGDKKDGEKE